MKETSLGTSASSFKERKEFLDKRGTEMSANMRDRDNKDDTSWMGTNKSSYRAAKAKEKAGTPLSADETATIKVGDRIAPRIKEFNKREIESLKAKDIKAIAGFMSESQIKAVKDSEKYSDKEKEEINHEWHNTSGSSPLGEAKAQINILRDIRDELTHLGVVTPTMSTHTTAGATMNLANIKAMTTETEDLLADARQDSRNSTLAPAARKVAEKQAIKLQKAVAELKNLADKTGKVGVEVGGKPAAKEFTVD